MINVNNYDIIQIVDQPPATLIRQKNTFDDTFENKSINIESEVNATVVMNCIESTIQRNDQ